MSVGQRIAEKLSVEGLLANFEYYTPKEFHRKESELQKEVAKIADVEIAPLVEALRLAREGLDQVWMDCHSAYVKQIEAVLALAGQEPEEEAAKDL